MMYIGFDQAGDALFNEEAPSVGHLLVMHDPSEEGGLDRTFRQVVRDNDGYIEDENGVVVYDADDDEEFEP